jgi:hypothetical protein
MDTNDILEWLDTEFYPVTLATPQETIQQIIGNAKRYFNTHSSYPIAQMFPASPGTPFVDLTTAYKGVHQVLPATQPDWILANYPVWSLLGVTVIDNLTSDLITLGEAYKNYRYYMGTDFKWNFQKSDDPFIAPKLYFSNIPSGTSSICVIGSARIQHNTPITSEHILNWLLYYVKALVKITEGNTIRKSSSIGIVNDGQQLIDEGKEEVAKLQEQLAQEGRWVTLCKRF